MIKTPISGKLECLTLANIHHDLFIAENYREIHLWNVSELKETLQILESREIEFRSILKHGEGEDEFYIIKF